MPILSCQHPVTRAAACSGCAGASALPVVERLLGLVVGKQAEDGIIGEDASGRMRSAPACAHGSVARPSDTTVEVLTVRWRAPEFRADPERVSHCGGCGGGERLGQHKR
eukprot:4315926-Pyramimonas_sp.AAC.1